MRASAVLVGIGLVACRAAPSPPPAAPTTPAAPAAPATPAPAPAAITPAHPSADLNLAFVLVRKPVLPDPVAVVASARRFGLELVALEAKAAGVQGYRAGDVTYVALLKAAPHPHAAELYYGMTSPPRDQAIAAPAHLAVMARGLAGDARARDTRLAAFTAAIVQTTPAVGAMFGHGILLHRPDAFAELVALGVPAGAIAPELAIDVAVVREDDQRLSLRTHNMPRYGREDLWVTFATDRETTLEFLFGIVRWLLADPTKHLPTGDTIGRTATEKVTVQRVPNPADPAATVIRLDLP